MCCCTIVPHRLYSHLDLDSLPYLLRLHLLRSHLLRSHLYLLCSHLLRSHLLCSHLLHSHLLCSHLPQAIGSYVTQPEAGERLASVIADEETAKSGIYWSWNGNAQYMGVGNAGGSGGAIFENTFAGLSCLPSS